MKKQVAALCTAGLLAVSLITPASAASLQNIRRSLPATAHVAVRSAEEAKPTPDAVPDAKGSVSFQNLEGRIRAGNPSLLSVQATLRAQQAFDRDYVYKNMVDAINAMTEASWILSTDPDAQAQAGALRTQAESMRTQLESLKEENYKETMLNLTWQLESSMNQIVAGGESLYLSILSYEASLSELARGLASIDRSIVEMELRYQLGQVSRQALEQLRSTRLSTASQKTTMELGLDKMYASLAQMLGEPLGEKLTLAPLPAVHTQKKALTQLGYDAALKKAKEQSFALYSAAEAFKDAAEVWDDAKADFHATGYQYKMAEQTYQSAVHTHDAAIKGFELSFLGLYQAISDTQQAQIAAENSYVYQQQVYRTAELKAAQGQISTNQLQSAKDELETARLAAQSAAQKSFTAYQLYSRAIETGLIA